MVSESHCALQAMAEQEIASKKITIPVTAGLEWEQGASHTREAHLYAPG